MAQKLSGRKNKGTAAGRKRAEESLRESEERYSNLFNNSAIGIYRTTPGGTIEMANPALVRMLGFASFEELARRNLEKDGYAPQYPRSEFIQRIERDGEVRGLESAWKRKDGASLFIRENARLVRDRNGKPVCYEGTVEDITERKQTEEELHKSELRFKALIENAFEGVSIIDACGKVKYESPRLKNILGYSPQETIGTEAFKHVHPDDMVMTQERFGLLLAHPDETLHLEVRIKHKNGSWRWIESAGRNQLDNPSINGIVINFRDITEQKKTEEERQRLEQQVRQAQKLESLGVLAGGIAHDFNNLLGGIFGFIEMANAESKDSAVSGYLGTALSTIDRARNLTRQLLTFAKGGVPVRAIGSLAPLIREAALFSLSGSNVSSSFDIPDNLLTCNFDRNQIAQVIDNIVINAQQAMPTGGTIRISAANVHLKANTIAMLLAGSYLKISIADTGIGIPREVLPRIFDPFFTTKQKGSGLGLTTCYSIMIRHEGWIDVESEPGRGSTFHLYLPASGEAPAAEPPQHTVVHRGSGSILVMDDDDTVRAAFGKILMTFGYSVTGTREGKETLQVLTEETKEGRPFAAVILDLTIPGGMGGKETINEIRKRDTRLPVFVASGYTDDPLMANPGKFGFTDCIRKPFRIDELAVLLNRHLPVSP